MKEIPNKTISQRKENGNDTNSTLNPTERGTENNVAESYRMPFLMLGLDLPPPPLFQDVMEKNIIPQVMSWVSSIFFSLSLRGGLHRYICHIYVIIR